MIKIYWVCLSALLCAGCASTSALKQCVNGDKWEVRSNRLFWQTENVVVSVDTNGFVNINVNKTGADAAALGTMIGAGIKAAK